LIDRVVGTDYLFCGNGEHGNPELEVVELMAKRWLKAPGNFKFWFNSSEAVAEKDEFGEHMAEVQKLVRQLAKKSNGRMRFGFLETGSSLRVV
jgi:hypothetical protein